VFCGGKTKSLCERMAVSKPISYSGFRNSKNISSNLDATNPNLAVGKPCNVAIAPFAQYGSNSPAVVAHNPHLPAGKSLPEIMQRHCDPVAMLPHEVIQVRWPARAGGHAHGLTSYPLAVIVTAVAASESACIVAPAGMLWPMAALTLYDSPAAMVRADRIMFDAEADPAEGIRWTVAVLAVPVLLHRVMAEMVVIVLAGTV
jgi:hypothetical protein